MLPLARSYPTWLGFKITVWAPGSSFFFYFTVDLSYSLWKWTSSPEAHNGNKTQLHSTRWIPENKTANPFPRALFSHSCQQPGTTYWFLLCRILNAGKKPKLELSFPIDFNNIHLSAEAHLKYLLQKWNVLQKNKPNSRTINIKRKLLFSPRIRCRTLSAPTKITFFDSKITLRTPWIK